FVLLNRPADRAAKLIEPQLALLADDVVEKVRGVKRVVSHIFKYRTVKLVTTRFGDDADLSAGPRTKLSRIVVGIDPEFLHVLERRLEPKWRGNFTVKITGTRIDDGRAFNSVESNFVLLYRPA